MSTATIASFQSTDAKGLTYTTSVREVEPRGALETLIRHFTDPRKRSASDNLSLTPEADQLRMAHTQSRDARDYSIIRARIAQDFYRAAGVREKAVAPMPGREQIAELNKYAGTLPFFSTDRKEFKEAARIAEERLQSVGAEANRRETEEPRALNSRQPGEQSLSSTKRPTV